MDTTADQEFDKHLASHTYSHHSSRVDDEENRYQAHVPAFDLTAAYQIKRPASRSSGKLLLLVLVVVSAFLMFAVFHSIL